MSLRMSGSLHLDNDLDLTPTLKTSIREGMCAAAMVGLGESYLSAFGIFLRASTVQIGLLASLPQFIGAIIQLISVWALRFMQSRKRLMVTASTCNTIVWLPIAVLAFFYSYSWSPAALIGCVVLYYCAAGMNTPVWNSVMGDIVPASFRGRFFGLRNRNVGFLTFVGMMAGGLILQAGNSLNITAAGFFVIFLLAGLARLASTHLLNQYEVPPHVHTPSEYFSLWDFIRRSPRSNFAKFVYFISTINCAVAFAGPYFAVYMLDVMKLSYIEFTVVNAAQMVAQFLTMQYWGKLADRFGNKKVLNVCGILVGAHPLLWFFASHVWHLLVIQVISGFVWAGFNLASANFIFDAVTPPKRARCVAYHNFMNAIFVLAGSLAGGYAAKHIPATITIAGGTIALTSSLLWVIGLSAIMRLVAAFALLPRFKEVRTSIEPIKNRELIFQIIHLRPVAGVTFDVFTGFRKRKQAAAERVEEEVLH